MSNVKFNYFLKNNPNNKRELPIVMTIIMSGERTQMFTGLWTVKSKWNQKYSKVIGTDPDSKSINDTLLSFISRGRRVVNELVVSGKPFNPNTVKDKLKNGFSKNLKTIESYNLFLERMERKDSIQVHKIYLRKVPKHQTQGRRVYQTLHQEK